MDDEDKEAAICYGNHTSSNKEADFINADLDDQLQEGHMAVSPLEAVNSLHKLWLSPVAVIPQAVRRLRSIFDFTRSGLNDISKRLSPMEAMRFGGALQFIHKQLLTNNPHIGPV